MSKLFTPKQLSEIPDLYSQENIIDPTCYAKIFMIDANFTWYITEISKEDMNLCFGYVCGLEKELGYFSLQEIEELKGSLGLVAEQDMHFTPTLLSEVKRAH